MAPNGLLLLYKTAGMTSQTAVNRAKRLLGAEKAGHTGTLDPMAEGVLPILLGRAVKASEFLLTSEKHYTAGLRLGITTDTEDTTGTVLTESRSLPTEAEVMAALARFRGEIWQTPPMYSALKVGGRKLCDLARKGVEIEREARPITVYSLEAERQSDSDYILRVHCSKGTYIRTLCADIGRALGCGGAMSSLCRTEAAGFPLARAVRLEELEAMSEEDRAARILPIEAVFSHLPRVELADFFARLAHHGASLYQKKLRTALPEGVLCTLYDKDGFFALARAEIQIEENGEEAEVLRPIRQFSV